MEPILQVTERAILALHSALEAETQAHVGIRVGIQGGGCSGFQWVLDIEDTPQETDFIQEVDGIKIYMDPMSIPYLQGTELDYLSTLQASGFVFKNDKVKRTCGCGMSVSF
jgi:iron-sulfur cluster assembly accessory protein